MKRETRRDASGEEMDIALQDVKQGRAAARMLQRAEPDAFRYANMGTAEIVASCAKTYGDEVARLTLLGEFDAGEIKGRATALWRAVLPDVVDRRTTLAYIACIAWGTKMQLLTHQDTKAMMFLAQTQLSVLKSLDPSAPPAPKVDSGELFARPNTMEPRPDQVHK